MVENLIRMLKADLFIEFFDSLMKPLPQMAQAIVSTLFISIIPIFLIFWMNKAVMGGKD